MTAISDPLAGIATSERELGCYSRLFWRRARVLEPAHLGQLKRIFAFARADGRRVTLRAGAHSFDAQALGDDLVVSMMRFDGIEVLDEVPTKAKWVRVRVGPGARWGAILAELQPLGLVPAVTVTTEDATAGGTLSGDCLSRFSPSWGKEGMHVKSFDLLTTRGDILTCAPPPEGGPPSTRSEHAFFGVIGGLGYLGAVVSITYEVLNVGHTDGKIGVRTRVHQCKTFEELAEHLVPDTEKAYIQESDARKPQLPDAIYSALLTSTGSVDALHFTSAFTTETKRRRMPHHQPRLALRVVVEWALRRPALAKLVWRFAFRFLYREGKVFRDDLEGFTFFMDGNARAKRIAQRWGFTQTNVQQTFVVPIDPVATAGWEHGQHRLVKWLERAHALLEERDLKPTLHDVLFLPPDERFLLSATADMAGFAVSYAFETSDKATIERVKKTFSDLADVLLKDFDGRVYLVKNVCATKETLREMYGQNAVDFFGLKRELDPDTVLRNGFLERTFGDFLNGDPEAAAPPAPAVPAQ